MKVERQQVGTVDVLAPIGALVDPEAVDFLELLQKQVGSMNPRVVISMHEVPYIDSAGIEGLLDASDELHDRATTLKLAAVPSTCREIFELTGTAPRFSFFSSVSDAVRSFL